MIAEERGRYHSEPLFARFGMLTIEDLYHQQLRMHAWQFWNNRLPEGQAALLQRTTERHRYETRSAGSSICIDTRDQGSIKYRIPKEWSSVSDEMKNCRSIVAFKNKSKKQITDQYRKFECKQAECIVCAGSNR